MFISVRQLGNHRGAPRLYLDTQMLAAAGFLPGTGYHINDGGDQKNLRVTLTLHPEGDRSCFPQMPRWLRSAGRGPQQP